MKKLTLFAMAVPALFAACSQEDIVTNTAGQPSELLGKVAGDVEFVFNNNPETRLTWAPNGDAEESLKWNAKEGDAFSLFWVGALNANCSDVTGYTGKANALYKSTNGSEFKSENIIYEGNHVIVYPADYAHYTEKTIAVSVPNPQNASDDLGTKRTVAVSDLLTIKAPYTYAGKQEGLTAAEKMEKETKENGTIFAGGYGKDVEAGVNVLSSHMVLHLNFNLQKLEEVVLRSVKLVSDKAIFATGGKLMANEDGFVSLTEPTLVKEITLNTGDVKINKEKGTYMAQISLLPPSMTNATDATYSIVVETNYGIVTIDKALDVTTLGGVAQSAPLGTTEDEEGNEIPVVADEDTPLSFITEFNNISFRNPDDQDEKTEGIQSEETYGKRIIRNVNVDMAETSISNWAVTDSPSLIAAYEMYDNLGRADSENPEETFVLKGIEAYLHATTNKFVLTPQAVKAINEHADVTLNLGDKLNRLELAANEGDQFTEFPVINTVSDENKGKLEVWMNSGNTWTLNIYGKCHEINKYKSFKNYGVVTLTDDNVWNAETNNWDNVKFSKQFVSVGTVNFDLDWESDVNYDLSGTINVPAGENVSLTGDNNTISGTLNVNGELVIAEGQTTLNGTTNVTGSLLSTNAATLINEGTIWVKKDDASIIISKQLNGGIIELSDRHDNVRVSDASNQGYIKWTCDEETLTKDNTDVFNYVRIPNSINWVQDLGIDYIEITGSKVEITGEATSLNKVIVNNGNTLVIPTGSSMTTTTVANGKVQVYGTFIYGTNNYTTIYDFSDNGNH